MLTNDQIIEAKTNWAEMLREKVGKWKADTDIYLNNSENLVRDDVIDIARGIWTQTIITKKQHKLQEIYLSKDGELPIAFMVRLDAITAYAVDMGIDIEYDLEFIFDTVRVLWKVNNITNPLLVENWESKPMELTRARVIDEVAETEEAEKAA